MRPIAIVLALMLAGCGQAVRAPASKRSEASPRRSAPAAPVRTDRTHYVLANGPQGPEATIVATLRAPADRTLYIVNCNGATGVTLQRKVGEEWVWSWIIAMNACLSPPIVIPPGGEHTARIYVHERSGGVAYPKGAAMIESGTYRVAWTGVFTGYDANAPYSAPELPLEQRVSSPITIEVP